jgi:hypothetical protein
VAWATEEVWCWAYFCSGDAEYRSLQKTERTVTILSRRADILQGAYFPRRVVEVMNNPSI